MPPVLGGIPRKRSRTVDVVRPYQVWSNNVLTSNSTYTFRTGEFTSDERHLLEKFDFYLGNSPKKKNFYDTGGPFLNQKTTYWDSGKIYSPTSGPYRGLMPQLPVANTLVDNTFGNGTYWAPAVPASSIMELDAFGATAISRCAPTNPHAQILTSIGELYRDGLPSAVGIKTIRDRDPGSEFLNYQFGIAPLVSDLKDLHRSLTESERILKRYLRDSGRLVRRRYEQPESVETFTSTVVGSANIGRPSVVGPLYAGSTSGATRVATRTETSRRWFSGAFTYHAAIPDGLLNNMRLRIQEYNQLLGILPTPAVLWNLTPWSWAFDWVANMGDVLNNISMFQSDGLVLAYGYVMEHKTTTREYHLYGYSMSNAGAVNEVQRFTSEVKFRRRATPYGFGLKLEDFTNRQWAILIALGLSQGKGLAR